MTRRCHNHILQHPWYPGEEPQNTDSHMFTTGRAHYSQVLHRLLFLLLFGIIFVFCAYFEMQYPVSVLVAIISLGFFALSCGCRCSVSLYCGAVCWSVIVEFSGHIHLILVKKNIVQREFKLSS